MPVATLRAKHAALRAVFTERSRRLWAATEARALGGVSVSNSWIAAPLRTRATLVWKCHPDPSARGDPNQAAKLLIDIVSGEVEDTLSAAKKAGPGNQRAGGLKGSAARARKLSPSERTDIARMAATARWKKRK